MRPTDHIAAARGFMEPGERLREWGDNRAAGMVIYGGVAEVINALAHDLGMKRAERSPARADTWGVYQSWRACQKRQTFVSQQCDGAA